jgi:hypothetical protein
VEATLIRSVTEMDAHVSCAFNSERKSHPGNFEDQLCNQLNQIYVSYSFTDSLLVL